MNTPILSLSALAMLCLATPLCAETVVATNAPVETASATVPTNVLPVISVTALRLAEANEHIPAMVSTLSAEEIAIRQARNFPDTLREEPGVMVQKTSPGQGSPYIRGFTGYRTLLMVDGIRLNTSVMRDGPNQYWNTVDSYALSGLDLVRGPASSLYGSDAVGGVVQAFTLMPEYAPEGTSLSGSSIYGRVSSAERSVVSRAVGQVAQEDWAVMGGFTYKLFGDLEGGKDVGKQPKTGYEEFDFDLKLRMKLKGDRELIFAHQQVQQDDVWRTHKTIYGISWKGTTVGNELEHVYDQSRSLSYAKLVDREANSLYDMMTLAVYLGWQGEQQSIVNPKGTKAKDSSKDGFDVYTPGFTLEMQKDTSWGTWVWGADYSRDIVSSWRDYYNSNTGQLVGKDIQGVIADDSTYDMAGIFVEDRIRFLNERLEVIPGLRATFAAVDAGAYDDLTQSTASAGSFNDSWFDVCGNVRAAYYLLDSREGMIYTGVGQAFRAPNLSDLTSLNATRTSSYAVPSTDLDPEHFVTWEIGTKWAGSWGGVDLAYFYTWIDDLMTSVEIPPPPGARDPGSKIYTTRENGSDGYVQGVELMGHINLTDQFMLRGGFTWMEGYNKTDGVEDYLRTMPITAIAALRWRSLSGRYWAEFAGYAADREDRLTAGDKTDTSRIPPDGTPGYCTWAARIGWNPTERIAITAACENIFDVDYRVYGSGSNEAGRNFILAAKYTF